MLFEVEKTTENRGLKSQVKKNYCFYKNMQRVIVKN